MNSSKVLSLATINPLLLNVRYAVRGEIPIRASEIREDLLVNPSAYNFSEIAELNIGNPQFFEFKKIEPTRHVMSRLLRKYSPHINLTSSSKTLSPEIESEIDQLADEYFSVIGINDSLQNLSTGIPEKSVSRFITKRDGLESHSDLIFPGNGASQSIHTIMNLLIDSPNAGIMCSVPTYPLYSALTSLFGGTFVKYNLDEEDNWNVNMKELEESYENAKKNGVNVKAIVLINPGNPTGNVFDLERMKEIVDFCYRKNIVILADEVYQENIMAEDKSFHSFKSVLAQADSNIRDNLELISFHSISKGLLGECGLRGGYMELDNFHPEMVKAIGRLNRLSKANLSGTLCLDLKSRFLSGELLDYPNLQNMFDTQVSEKEQEMKERAKIVENILNDCVGVKTNKIEGALYAFPQIYPPKKFIKKAEEQGVIPDFLYCKELLESTGLCTVPGSGFGQKDGTFHFRTTILPSPNSHLNNIMLKFKEFNDGLHENYS